MPDPTRIARALDGQGPAPGVKRRRRRLAWWLAGVTLILAVAGGSGLLLYRRALARSEPQTAPPLVRRATLKGTGTFLAWNVDSQLLATIPNGGGPIQIWDVGTGQQMQRLRGPLGHLVNSVSWSPNGAALAVGYSGTAIIWEPTSGHELARLQGHNGQVFATAWDPSGKRLVTAGEDATGVVWDAASAAAILTLKGHEGPVLSATWSPDGKRLATRSRDGTVKIWDPDTGSCLLTLACRDNPKKVHRYHSLLWSPDGHYLAANSGSTVIVWDPDTGKRHAELPMKTDVGIIGWSPDSSMVASGSLDDSWYWRGTLPDRRLQPRAEVILWSAETGERLTVLTKTGRAGSVGDIEWSPDGQMLAVDFATGGSVDLWDARGKNHLGAVKGPSHVVSDLEWSPDGQSLAVAYIFDKTVVWKRRSQGAPTEREDAQEGLD